MQDLLESVLRLMEHDAKTEAPGPLSSQTLGLLITPGIDRWWVIAFDPRRSEAKPVPSAVIASGPEAALSSALIEPFRGRILQGREVRVFADQVPRSIDVHALVLDGEPLLTRVPVSYGLDLSPAPGQKDTFSRILVVTDPREDLPAARREHAELKRLLGKRPVELRMLSGRAADARRVRSALTWATHFHYAGHAHVDADLFASGLLLGGTDQLTIGDILVLERVPEVVVLSGCETGRSSSTEVRDVDLGIAQAFLIRGAHRVLATSRPVTDTLAEAVSVSVHRYGGVTPEGVQKALLAVARALPHEDWSAYRLLVR